MLYEALGDPKMLEAAHQAYKFSKNSQTAALVAVALHHFGRIKEAIAFYEQSWKYPHEPGYEIDVGASGAFLFNLETWPKAWKIVRSLKKRMVYALYLPEWDGGPCEELSIVSEGGYGDLIQNSRFLPLLKGRGVGKAVVYLPPYFFETGFVDLMRGQTWMPEIRPMLELPKDVPAAGFFDLPAHFNVTPQTLPEPPIWCADSELVEKYKYLSETALSKIGICYAARAMETPLVAENVYRTIRKTDAERIVGATNAKWVSLQKDETLNGYIFHPPLKSWADTAAVIQNLDLVVTVDTGVAHLAASMNKPTWVMLSGAVDWKFQMEGEKCLWYPQMRLFRNDDFGFDNTIKKVISALSEFNSTRK